MINKMTLIGLGVVAILSAGCATEGPMPLIFGQSHTVGLSISGSMPEQGAAITLGYRDYDIAIVPVEEQATADHKSSKTVSGNSESGEGQHADAFSTFGQFKVDGDANSPSIGLGKFFATGMAARELSEGFRCGVSDGKHESCTAKQPVAPPQPVTPGA